MIVDEIDNGQRLDHVLRKHKDCLHLGTRARKRFCEEGFVLVNGMQRNAAYKVYSGQEITIAQIEESEDDYKLETLEENEDFIAFYKEKFLPTEEIKGSSSRAIEYYIKKENKDFILLNRLDTLTSGIIICAKNEEAKNKWKIEQDLGKIEKKYYALVEDNYKLNNEICINNAIDLSKTKVKALEKSEIDRNRYTIVNKVEDRVQAELRNTFMPQDLSIISSDYERVLSGKTGEIVSCTIYKGVRHQIRCHLASVSMPLIGDSIYGNETMEELFFLHHYKIVSDLIQVEIK